MPTTAIAQIPHAVRDVYSKEIIHAATPRTKFAQFAKRKEDLKTKPGSSIKFTKFNSITKGGALTEGVALSEKQMSTAEVDITVTEYGNAIKVTEKAIQQSMFDVLDEAVQALGNDAAQVLDDGLRDACLTSTNYVYAQGKANAGALVSGDAFDTEIIKDAVEQLESNNAPKIGGEYYVCFAHPHQLRELRDDNDWIETHKYNGVDQIFRGEVGMYEGVRFISTTQMPANTAGESLAKYGNNIPTWEGVIFGENSFAWAIGLDIELRDGGIDDYGREHGLAWYAMWGFGLIEEDNIFVLLSA